MPQTDHDLTIAMAGLFQATSLISDIAHTGQINDKDLQVCLASLLKIDAASSEDVYGGISNLRSGLRLLSEHLRKPTTLEITRYAVTLLVLERKFAIHPALIKRIRKGVEAISATLNQLPLTDGAIVKAFAELYSATISRLSPRVMVHGESAYLTKQDNANRIRALLLAGIRAATLWRQSGGGRFTLLFKRKALLREAQRLLSLVEE